VSNTFDKSQLGETINFSVPGKGSKVGVVVCGVHCRGTFIGYDVIVDSEDCTYGGIFRDDNGNWVQGTLRLVFDSDGVRV